jgi:hypothetical protein
VNHFVGWGSMEFGRVSFLFRGYAGGRVGNGGELRLGVHFLLAIVGFGGIWLSFLCGNGSPQSFFEADVHAVDLEFPGVFFRGWRFHRVVVLVRR